jgi:hypothetical protein
LPVLGFTALSRVLEFAILFIFLANIRESRQTFLISQIMHEIIMKIAFEQKNLSSSSGKPQGFKNFITNKKASDDAI